jgi:hypothetical protein
MASCQRGVVVLACLSVAAAWSPSLSGPGFAIRPATRSLKLSGNAPRSALLPLQQQSARIGQSSRRSSLRTIDHKMVALGGIEKVQDLKMPSTASNPWEVHKFGGASLADAGLYRTVGDLLITYVLV